MNTAKNTTPTVTPGALTALRDLGREPASSMEAMRHIAAEQARLLRRLLPGLTRQSAAYLADLVPTVVVEHVARPPVPGITYWANHRWHIHVREDESADEQAFTVLHQLKCIIDHPLRRAATVFGDADWDALANHFASQVLIRESIRASA